MPQMWPDSMEAVRELLEGPNGPRFSITLKDALKAATGAQDATLALKPQLRYTVVLLLRIDPIYRVHKWTGAIELETWRAFVEGASIETSQLDYSRRSKAQVKIMVKILDSSTRQQKKNVYDFNDLNTSLGAWMGLWGVGLGLLTLWQAKAMPFGMSTEDDAGAVLGPLAEAADAKAMKKLDNKFRLLSCSRRNEEATKEFARREAEAGGEEEQEHEAAQWNKPPSSPPAGPPKPAEEQKDYFA
jgi:hypothetical protein